MKAIERAGRARNSQCIAVLSSRCHDGVLTVRITEGRVLTMQLSVSLAGVRGQLAYIDVGAEAAPARVVSLLSSQPTLHGLAVYQRRESVEACQHGSHFTYGYGEGGSSACTLPASIAIRTSATCLASAGPCLFQRAPSFLLRRTAV